jgi:hypothetical protein
MEEIKNKQPNLSARSEISVEITDHGIRRVLIYADNPDQQARAHRLLARIAGQMCGLDLAVKAVDALGSSTD